MTYYIKKHLLLDAIKSAEPSANDYDITNPDNKSLSDIAYWAAKDMYDDIVSIAEHIEPKDEWINVKDRTPEPHKRVLLCRIIGSIKRLIVGYYDGQYFRYDIDDLWQYKIPFITHWREFPELPELTESEEDNETDI